VGVPALNLDIYSKLNVVENVLRELLIEELSRLAGPRWYKTRLPPDVLSKFRNSVDFCRQVHWTEMIPHHPIYHTDFGDLRKIIERGDNWNDTFGSIFRRKDFIVALLGQLETIRNTTAHNRKNSALDCEIVSSALNQLRSILGLQRFDELSSRFTALSSIRELLSELKNEGSNAAQACSEVRPIEALPVWSFAHGSWWFDDHYLGADLRPVKAFFNCVTQYKALPRPRGSGHHIEEWLSSNNVETLFLASHATLDKLTSTD
jgi:hypothetical protein